MHCTYYYYVPCTSGAQPRIFVRQAQKKSYRISTNNFLPWIVFPSLKTFSSISNIKVKLLWKLHSITVYKLDPLHVTRASDFFPNVTNVHLCHPVNTIDCAVNREWPRERKGFLCESKNFRPDKQLFPKLPEVGFEPLTFRRLALYPFLHGGLTN